MKKYFFLPLLLTFMLLSCDKKSKIEKAVDEIPVKIEVNRFDKAFFESTPNDLPKLKQQYPFFFPAGNDDAIWIEKIQHPQWRELYAEVEKKYSNFETETNQIEVLFKHIKYYFPKTKIPKVFTIISEMDYQNKVIYANDMLVISLELYLGKDHRFYEFPEYLKQNFEQSQILPDIVTSFSRGKISPASDHTFLSQMVYAGKELYIKDLLLPEYSDADKMGYKPEQITWCQENESYMWRYFIEKKLLYDTDQKLIPRFINPAPFSKFYLEIDNESPGRVGSWIGWQIVRSYMENNEVSLEQLLQMDAKEIFEKSKYKPKKIMAKTITSEIKFLVELDENRVPEKLTWTAQDGGVDAEEAKAMMLSIWDNKAQETLRIDLWTKEMPVDEMKLFFHQTLVAMSDTYRRATGDEKMSDTMKDFCDYFAEKLELNK